MVERRASQDQQCHVRVSVGLLAFLKYVLHCLNLSLDEAISLGVVRTGLCMCEAIDFSE